DMETLSDGATHSDKFILYVGPISEDDLVKAGEGFEEARQIFLRSIVGPIAHIMLRLLQGIYKIIPNYGLVIIVLTLLMKILMFPIYQKQIHTTKKMQALQPQINALKEKYKNDQQKLQKEQMELFRKHKVNPLSGCLTMLTTIPIFIALYATFAMAVELRGAPFFGWIQDLSAPDNAFFLPISSYIIPVNILPIAYAVLMLWSTSQQSMEGPNAAAMKILPLIFVFIFWTIASGVILYFVVSIFLDVCQRLIMDKLKGDGPAPPKPAQSK
ncbi:MAG: membrane protein insertase YidC, partial [Candidatus Hinthialibacter sp.]